MIQAAGAERAVLSILFNKPESLFLIDNILEGSDFTNFGNKAIYSLLREIVIDSPDTTIDQYVLISKAEEKGLSDFLSLTHDGELIEALDATKGAINPDTLPSHVSAIKTASIKRNVLGLIEGLSEEIEEFDGKPIDLVNHIEDKIYSSLKYIDNDGDDIENLSDDFESVINSFADGDFVQSLNVSMPRWQKDSGGIRNGTVTGIFARAKEGKSQIAAYLSKEAAIDGHALNMIEGFEEQKIPVLYLDSELQLRDQQMRVASMMTGIKYEEIESGSWKSDADKVAKIRAAFEKIKDAPFYYKSIAGRSISYIIPIIRKFVQRHVNKTVDSNIPQCLVVYDYIKLTDSRDLKTGAEWQLLGFLVGALHDLAVQLNIPMVVFGQLNREALKVDSVSTVGGSDRITHNLDSLTLFRKKREEEIQLDGTQRGSHIMKVLLARRGAGHDYDDWVNVHFDKSAGQFKEDKRNSEITESIKNLREVRDRLNGEDTQNFGGARQSG